MKCAENSRGGLPPVIADSEVSLACSLTQLFKLRVVGLLVFAAMAGAFAGAHGWPGAGRLLLLCIVGGLASTGASAINEYLERDADARMARTADRPMVTGAIPAAAWVWVLGVVMIAAPAVAVLPANPALALFLTLGAIIYIGVYTLWLKPRSPLNVVIGGAAGSCAVLSGGAAVGAWSDFGVLALALLIFFWSPTHFWSLALACREDYERAGTPMLPVVTTARRAAMWGLIHALASGLAGLALALQPGWGWAYALPTLAVTLLLWREAVCLVAHPTRAQAWRLFHTSNVYLGLVLVFAGVASLM
jgi:heme o synthase